MIAQFRNVIKHSGFILLPASLPLATGVMFIALASGCASDPPMVTTTTDHTSTTQVQPVPMAPESGTTETTTRSQSYTP